MTRFEIQDISRQTAEGVTFRAIDTLTGDTVALRRFFPFGQDEEGGEGLDTQEGKAFAQACMRLSEVRHPRLRRTVMGDIDPIDGMPYLVTEWLDGESLTSVLQGNQMEPSAIITLVEQALEVSILLSGVLENEAVWIDTKPEAIIVCDADTNPTFTFRICPFKWLGTQSHQRDLMGIVSMVEELIGWKSRLVSDQAGMGLGGLLKKYRQFPQMPLTEAIQLLPKPSVNPLPPQLANETPQFAQKPLVLASVKPSGFRRKSLIVIGISVCSTIAIIVFFYQLSKPQLEQVVPVESANGSATQNVSNPIETKAKKQTARKSDAEDVNARAIRMREELARIEEEKKSVAKDDGKIKTITPDDIESIGKMPLNAPVSIRGLVKSVVKPPNSQGIYIAFSDPWDEKQNRVVLYAKLFEGGPYKEDAFISLAQEYQYLVGKTVLFNGTVTRHVGKKEPHFVQINTKKQIVVEN